MQETASRLPKIGKAVSLFSLASRDERSLPCAKGKCLSTCRELAMKGVHEVPKGFLDYAKSTAGLQSLMLDTRAVHCRLKQCAPELEALSAAMFGGC